MLNITKRVFIYINCGSLHGHNLNLLQTEDAKDSKANGLLFSRTTYIIFRFPDIDILSAKSINH